jgi:hypothetical protein
MRGFTRIDGPVQIVAVRVRDPSPSSSGSRWFLRFFGRQPPDRLMPSSRCSSRVANQLPVVVSFVLALCFACWFTATGRKPNLNTNSTFLLAAWFLLRSGYGSQQHTCIALGMGGGGYHCSPLTRPATHGPHGREIERESCV